ncbi:30S ribosomal protein S16 [bacterium]|nr:30S ribosomal protein S16 [bacterium]|tara:strand:- start:136 stop:732 length:597 start_codon:yes stop_codon:yes gene_type:complete
MLMMRLQRVGRRNDPSFRIVVTDKRTGPKSNKNIAILGSYNPKMDHVQLDKEEAKKWLGQGVQPSDTVHNILVSEKVIEGDKINVLPSKTPILKEEEKVEGASAEGDEVSAEEVAETSEPAEETPVETEEVPKEEVAEETPAEESVSAEEVTDQSEEVKPTEPESDEADKGEVQPEEKDETESVEVDSDTEAEEKKSE